MYKCEIITDSLSPTGDRLTTYKVTYPRIIHAEMLRHRMLSRNVASSRAIPFKKMVKDVEKNPFVPIAFQKPHKGMQGNEYWTDNDIVTVDEGDEYEVDTKIYSATEHFITEWLEAKDLAVSQAYELNRLGVTKQLCNRLLEPFVWTTELISGTEWDNFFELRCPLYFGKYKSWKDACVVNGSLDFEAPLLERLNSNASQAEIHIQRIAEMMWDAYNESTPKQLEAGEWHIPYGDKINLDSKGTVHPSDELYGTTLRMWYAASGIELPELKIATARCARLSYETLGDEPKIDYEADIKLHDRLLAQNHMSPFEHCAVAMTNKEYYYYRKGMVLSSDNDTYSNNTLGWCNNFKGFIQYRHLIN